MLIPPGANASRARPSVTQFCQIAPPYSRSPGFRTGNARMSLTSIRLKIAAFAPMPKASETTATAVNAGDFTGRHSADHACHAGQNSR